MDELTANFSMDENEPITATFKAYDEPPIIGGTTDYLWLENKPQINDITLVGNKTLDELGIQAKGDYALVSDIPDVSNFATKDEIPSLAGLVTEQQLTDGLATKQPIGDYALKSEIPDVEGFATRTAVVLLTNTVELADNTIFNGGEIANITITVPILTASFVCQINFTSGATATALIVPDTIKWLGDDITEGAFVPVTGKRYSIMFYYDGVQLRGAVQGV